MNKDILKTDKPIEKIENDILGRASFAKSVAKAIINYPTKDESLTIGIYGQWGDGKTSVVNMINEILEQKENIIIFNFKPWLYSDTKQLISHFFKEFSKSIKHKESASVVSKIGKELETYASFFEPLALVPEPTVAFLGASASKVFGSVGKGAKNWGDLKSKDLTAIKNSIEKHLQELNKKIVITIDDIDRLNNTEIRQIFQMIKVLGNFPNTVYLLIMDREVVTNALSEVQKGDGNDYLAKIVNVPFEIPKPPLDKIYNYLYDEIMQAIKNDENLDKELFEYRFKEFTSFFENIRDIKRYLNIFKFNYALLKGEVEISDLMIITAFQVFEPKVYEYLKKNKDKVPLDTREKDMFREPLDFKKDIDLNSTKNEMAKLIVKIDKNSFSKLLALLFSSLNDNSSDIKINPLKAHVTNPRYYDMYFSLSVDKNIISKSELNKILMSTKKKKDFDKYINYLIDNSKFYEFLYYLLLYIDLNHISEKQTRIIANVIFQKSDLFYEKDNREFLLKFIKTLILQEKNKTYLLKIAIDETNCNGLILACIFLQYMMLEHGEYEGLHVPLISDKLLNTEELDEVKSIINKKIKLLILKNKIKNKKNINTILHTWNKINHVEAKKFIENSNENKIILSFISLGLVGTRYDYQKLIKENIELDKIISKIENIQNKDYSTLNNKEKFVLDSFIQSYYEENPK